MPREAVHVSGAAGTREVEAALVMLRRRIVTGGRWHLITDAQDAAERRE